MTVSVLTPLRRLRPFVIIGLALLPLTACGVPSVMRTVAINDLTDNPEAGAISGAVYDAGTGKGLRVLWRRYGEPPSHWVNNGYTLLEGTDSPSLVSVPPGTYYIAGFHGYRLVGGPLFGVRMEDGTEIGIPRVGFVQVKPGQIVHIGEVGFDTVPLRVASHVNDTEQWREKLNARAPGLGERLVYQDPTAWNLTRAFPSRHATLFADLAKEAKKDAESSSQDGTAPSPQ